MFLESARLKKQERSEGNLTWLRMAPVLVLLLRAVYTDVRKGIIENRLMAAGVVTGTGVAALTGGAGLLLESMKCAALMFALLFFLYLAKGIGAGDVKLLCVLAVFFQGAAFRILAGAFFAAACMAAGRMLFRAAKRQSVFQKRETICFSVPVAASTALFFLSGVVL